MKKSVINYNEIINSISENPLVSIIIPVYKTKEHLEKCLDSVINQSYNNIEIILVDDGTPDESSIICEEYLLKDDRIVLVHKDNSGAASSRNIGIHIVRGEYFAFVDSDDYIHRDYIRLLLSFALYTNSDITLNKLKPTCIKDESLSENPEKIKYYTTDGKRAITLYDFKVGPCGKLYKTEATQNIRFFSNLKRYEDDDSYYRFGYCSKKICFADAVTYYYFQSDNSIMRIGNVDMSLEYIDIYFSRVKYFEERNENALVDSTYDRLCMIIALNYVLYHKNKTNVSDYGYLIKVFKECFMKIKHSGNVKIYKRVIYRIFEKFPNLITFFAIKLHIR